MPSPVCTVWLGQVLSRRGLSRGGGCVTVCEVRYVTIDIFHLAYVLFWKTEPESGPGFTASRVPVQLFGFTEVQCQLDFKNDQEES